MLLCAAAALAVSSFAVAWGHARVEHGHARRFVCPMHPEVTSATPGECPICRMALEEPGEASGSPPAPAPPPVASAAPQPVVPAPNAIHPWRSGDPADTSTEHVYPPFSFSAGNAVHEPLVAPAQRRAFVSPIVAPAWFESGDVVVALLYNDEIGLRVVTEQPGTFATAQAPLESSEVRATREPAVPWDASTSMVRFRLQSNTPARFVSGQVGWIKLPATPEERLTVPASALLQSTEGPYVLLAGEHGQHRRRDVRIGRVEAGHVAIVSGLAETDRVVVNGGFFLDAERRLRARAEAGAAP